MRTIAYAQAPRELLVGLEAPAYTHRAENCSAATLPALSHALAVRMFSITYLN